MWTKNIFVLFPLILVFTVPKVIDIPRYNMKCSEENEILRGILRVVSRFPLQYISCYIAEIRITFRTVFFPALILFLISCVGAGHPSREKNLLQGLCVKNLGC